MLKRTAVLTMLLMYLSTTVGFALSLHFCGTKISSIRITHDSKKPCCTKETESKTDDCCKDKQIKVKVSDQQRIIQTAKIPTAVNLNLLGVPAWITNSVSNTSTSFSRLSYRGPPVTSDVPLTIQNCIFRI